MLTLMEGRRVIRDSPARSEPCRSEPNSVGVRHPAAMFGGIGQALYRSDRHSARGGSWREKSRSAQLNWTLNRKHAAPLVTACCVWPRGGTNESAPNGDVLALLRHDIARLIKQDCGVESYAVSSRPQIVDQTIRRARSRTSECCMEWCGRYGLHCNFSGLPPIAR